MNLSDLNLLAAKTRRCWKIDDSGVRVSVSCAAKQIIADGADAIYDELQDLKINYVSNPAGFQLDRSHNLAALFGALVPIEVAARRHGYKDFAEVLGISYGHGPRHLHEEAEARAYLAARTMLGTTEERLQNLGKQFPLSVETLKGNWTFSKARAKAAVNYEVTRGFSLAGEYALRAAGGEWVKIWTLSGSHDQDDICDDNAEMGPIPLGSSFPSGDVTVPAHPNCNCEVTYRQVRA